jgi:hypothetical protein
LHTPKGREHEGRVPLPIKQARCLPRRSGTNLLIMNRLIRESWDWLDGMVTKSYVLRRGRLASTGVSALVDDPLDPRFRRRQALLGLHRHVGDVDGSTLAGLKGPAYL